MVVASEMCSKPFNTEVCCNLYFSSKHVQLSTRRGVWLCGQDIVKVAGRAMRQNFVVASTSILDK